MKTTPVQGVTFLTLTLILTSSVSVPGLKVGVSELALSKLPFPLTISQSIDDGSAKLRSVKVADKFLESKSPSLLASIIHNVRSLVTVMVPNGLISTLTIFETVSTHGTLGFAVIVKSIYPLSISVALAIIEGSRSFLFIIVVPAVDVHS